MDVKTTRGGGASNAEIQAWRKEGLSTEQIQARVSERTNASLNEQSKTSNKTALAKAAASVQKPDKKDVMDSVLNFFGDSGPIQSSIQSLDKSVTAFGNTINGTDLKGSINEDVYKRLKSQYANLYIATTVDSIGGSISGASENINASVTAASEKIKETLKPVSSFVGSTLGTLTGVMNDPIGSTLKLPNTIGNMMDRVNPGLKGKFMATASKHNLDKLAEMPSQIFGNLQQLAKTADNILSVPIGIVNDIYKGYTKLLGEINDFVNGLFATLQTFFNSILDSLFPGLQEFLTSLTEFANQVGGIASIFGAQTQILGFTNQIIQGANQLNSFIQNPLDLVYAYVPEQVSQGLYALQNPQQLINQFLPPQLTKSFATIESITGFGFNGNMGYGLGNVLQGVQNGVLASVAQGFSSQFSILAPLFSGLTPQETGATSYSNESGVQTTEDGTEYSTNKTSGAVIKTKQPEPNYGKTA